METETVKWFGDWNYLPPIFEGTPQIPVPIGAACIWCNEPIEKDYPGMQYSNGPNAHRECFLRAGIGSVAHLEKRCTHYVPGSDEGDPLGMTLREAAKAAVELWEKQQWEEFHRRHKPANGQNH